MLMEATGDAEAKGAVQLTYRRVVSAARPAQDAASAEAVPIHATGDRAVLKKESGVATIYGTATQRARLWQGGSQVEAPVLVFGKEAATLDAYGAAKDDAMPVRTVLVSKAAGQGEGDGPAGGLRKEAQVLRVQSGRLHYGDAARRAEFSGGVVLEDADGTMTSREAVATLLPAGKAGLVGQTPPPQEGLPGLAGGALERVTATGDVVVRQPGRVATGERGVYTVADGMFVLTGGSGAEPKVTDEANGSVRGAVLRFRSGDNSVTVDGRVKDGTAAKGDGRVHTRTKVKQ